MTRPALTGLNPSCKTTARPQAQQFPPLSRIIDPGGETGSHRALVHTTRPLRATRFRSGIDATWSPAVASVDRVADSVA